MKTFVHLLAGLALVAGIGLLVVAFITPSQYRMSEASAVQASQVYAMAAHYALLGIGVLLAGILVEVSMVAEGR